MEATYSKVNDTTLKISTVVEQDVTLDQLQEEQARLNQTLGMLEQQYTQQKADILAQIAIANKAVKSAEGFKLETTASLEAKEKPIEEPVEEPLETPVEGEVIKG